MIDWFEALVLGVVQGATEYLPVSSSGHLVIFQHLFGLTEPALLFDIVLHVATLIVVLWFYRRDVVGLMQQSWSAAGELTRGLSWSALQESYPGFRLAWLILIGTLPTAVIGFTQQHAFERLFSSLGTVGVMLWITGLMLLLTHYIGRGARGV